MRTLALALVIGWPLAAQLAVSAGQKVMASSAPVVIASDQSAFSVNIGTFPDNEPFNLNQVVGTAATVNNGAAGAGSLRIVLASDNSAIANWGLGATGSAVPSGAQYIGFRNDAGNLEGARRCDLKAAFDQAFTAGQSVQLVAAQASQKVYICHASVVCGGATNFKFTGGTGTNCGTGKTTTLGAYPFAANSGAFPYFGFHMVEGVTADAACVESSAAVTCAGHVQYLQF